MITNVNFESFINSNTLSETTELKSVALPKGSYYQAGYRLKENVRIPNKFDKQVEIDQYKKSIKELMNNFYERPLTEFDKLLMKKIVDRKGYRPTMEIEIFPNGLFEDEQNHPI